MIAFKSRLKAAVAERLRAAYPDLGELEMAPTPDPKLGDLALTFPFTLAKTLRKPPRAIALEPSGKFLLVANLASDSVVAFRIDPRTGIPVAPGHEARVGSPACVAFLPARGRPGPSTRAPGAPGRCRA